MKAQATFLMTILAASLSATAQEQAADFAENPSALSVLAQEQATVAEKQPEEQTAPAEEQAAPVEEQAPAAEEQTPPAEEQAPAPEEQPSTAEVQTAPPEETPTEAEKPAEQNSGQLLSVEDQIAAQEKLAAEQQQEQPEDNKAAAAVEDAIQEDDVDEIDLEEDDSAIAAKKPQIKGAITEGTMSLVDIECDEATLADILRQFRKTTGANIISGDSTNLQRRVSVSLKRVPWLEGLSAILGSRGFRLEPRDNIYRVIEDEQVIPVSTRTFTLNHASAKELSELFNARDICAEGPEREGPLAYSIELRRCERCGCHSFGQDSIRMRGDHQGSRQGGCPDIHRSKVHRAILRGDAQTRHAVELARELGCLRKEHQRRMGVQ